MVQIIEIVGATGFCPAEGCDDLHGTLQVYFEAQFGTTHPSLDEEFLGSLKCKLEADGLYPLDELELHPQELQGTNYVSLSMGTALAELWDSRMSCSCCKE